MTTDSIFDRTRDFAIEHFIDAPTRLVWEALTKPEHFKEWYMPKVWGRASRAEMDVQPGGIFSIDIAVGHGPDVPNLGCFLDVGIVGMKRRLGLHGNVEIPTAPPLATH